MSVRRLSNSTISTQGRGRSSTFLANYSPAIDEMDLIERVVVESGGVSSIDFNSIPQTYTHLEIRLVVRGTATSNNDWMYFTLNNQSTGTSHYLAGNGSAPDIWNYVNSAQPLTMNMPCANATSGIFGTGIIRILDYTNTSKNKTSMIMSGHDRNGAGIIMLSSHLYSSTSAVTSISLKAWGLSSFSQYTKASLYGVLG